MGRTGGYRCEPGGCFSELIPSPLPFLSLKGLHHTIWQCLTKDPSKDRISTEYIKHPGACRLINPFAKELKTDHVTFWNSP